MAAAFKTIPVGTRVTWRYRSGIGHGTIKSVHKLGTSPANTEYAIKVDAADLAAHKGEPSIRYHYGSNITVVSDHARNGGGAMATDTTTASSDPLEESIYKKLIAKGMSPKAARAFAKMAAARERKAKGAAAKIDQAGIQFYDVRGNKIAPIDLARKGKSKGVHLGFDKLQGKLQAQGHSPESAARIAAYIGRKKYGKRGFGKLVKAGMKK